MVASLIAVGVLAVILAAGLLVVLCVSFSKVSEKQKKKGTKIAPSSYRRAMLSAENPDDDLEKNDDGSQPVDASNAQIVQRYEQSVDQQTAEKPNVTPHIEMTNLRPEEAYHRSEGSQKQGQGDNTGRASEEAAQAAKFSDDSSSIGDVDQHNRSFLPPIMT